MTMSKMQTYFDSIAIQIGVDEDLGCLDVAAFSLIWRPLEAGPAFI